MTDRRQRKYKLPEDTEVELSCMGVEDSTQQPKPNPQQKKANDPATLRCDNEPCLFHHLGICHFACHMWQPCASHTPAHPPEAQQRVDEVIAYCNQRHFEVEDDDGTIYEVIPKGEIIALLQAGRK